MRRGAKISNQSYLAAKMYHTSAKLTFGVGEKFFGGTKSSRGRQKASGAPKSSRGRKKPIRKTKKIVVTFFFCKGAKNFSRGRRMVNMVNVTPLRRTASNFGFLPIFCP